MLPRQCPVHSYNETKSDRTITTLHVRRVAEVREVGRANREAVQYIRESRKRTPEEKAGTVSAL